MLPFVRTLRRAYQRATLAYEQGNEILSDDEFDLLERRLFGQRAPRRLLPTTLDLRTVKHKHFVPSLSKVKTEEEIKRWVLAQSPRAFFTLSAKLDGVHVTLTYDKGKLIQAATRGKHTHGLSVLLHTPHFKNMPRPSKRFRLSGTVEGELILPSTVFAKYKDSLFSNYTNPRATVAGLLRADDPDKTLLSHCLYYAFEVYEADAAPSTQRPYDYCQTLKQLTALGFSIPYALQVSSTRVTHQALSDFLTDAKRALPLALDGVVIRHNATAPEDARLVGKYPTHARAFKLPALAKSTVVLSVQWSATRTGLFSPLVHVEPVHIDGNVIRKVTGHNARFIAAKGLGPGAVITIARRGDTIPGIVSVVKPALASMPPEPHVWDKNRVHLLCNDPIARQVLALEHSLKTLNLKGAGPVLSKQLVEKGYTSLSSFHGKRAKHFAKFGKGNAEILMRLTQTLFETTWPRPLLMAASGLFPAGIGIERAAKVMSNPDYLKLSKNSEAKAIRENLDAYFAFEQCFKVEISPMVSFERVVVFTGFRNERLTTMLQTKGFGVSERLTKVAVLLVSALENSQKVQQAQKMKVPVLFISLADEAPAIMAQISKTLKLK